jgi:AcrR family transcriptional regulator
MTTESTHVLSLRERKKKNLRGKLIGTALRLFCDRGYEATTLEEICRDNDTHVRTLLRYFGSKEDLALAPAHEGLRHFERMLSERVGRGAAIACWREYVQDYWLNLAENPEQAFAYLQVLSSVPALRAKVIDLDRQFEEALSRAIAKDGGFDGDIYARLLATNLVAGARSVALRDLDKSDLAQVVANVVAVIDAVAKCFPSRDAFMRAWVPPNKSVRRAARTAKPSRPRAARR